MSSDKMGSKVKKTAGYLRRFAAALLLVFLMPTALENLNRFLGKGIDIGFNLASLELNADLLKMQVKNIESRLDSIELNVELSNFRAGVFSPGEVGFQRIDSSNGTFLVSLKDVKPYANGYRVFMDIGNSSSATFNNPKLDVKWGAPFPRDGTVTYSTWKNSLQSKVIPIEKKLLPSTWNQISFTLAPCTKEEIGRIEVAIETNQVLLNVAH